MYRMDTCAVKHSIYIISGVFSYIEKVYCFKISNADALKTRLIDEWAQFDQSIFDAAISQWRRRLSACVRVRGAHFEQILPILKRTVIQIYNSAK